MGAGTTEDVSSAVTQIYTAPVTLGQVMSFNDVNASVFWNFDCDNRGNHAFFSGMADGICVGKHIGQINGTRADEMLGYFVVETGTGTVNDISFTAAIGIDTGAGVGNAPPYSYAVTGEYDIGVLTQGGQDGGQGGWPILYGTDPLPSGQVQWAIEEEVVAGDMTRSHTNEDVGYWLFDNNQSPNMSARKSVNVYSGSVSPYAIPGSDMIYTIAVENSGSGPVDNDSIELIDAVPPETTFYNDDIDDGGPETAAVSFSNLASGLSFDPVNDVKFSNSITAPANFLACGYDPDPGYDPQVTYICLNPKGAFSEGNITAASFELSFRAMIN